MEGGFEKFSRPWSNSDTILVVEEHRFHVHRAVLGVYSPVFLAMFNAGFKENDEAEISLPGKNALEFLDLLTQVYVDVEICPIKMEKIEHILKLADEYQIRVVVERCKRLLHTQTLNTSNALRFLVLGQQYKFKQLREKCYPVLKKLELKSLRSQPQYDEMDEESYRKVVTARLEESEEILPDLQSLVWGLLTFAIELKPGSKVCRQHYKQNSNTEERGFDRRNVSSSRPAGGRVTIDARKGYVECPNCKTMYDEAMRHVENTHEVYARGIIQNLLKLS